MWWGTGKDGLGRRRPGERAKALVDAPVDGIVGLVVAAGGLRDVFPQEYDCGKGGCTKRLKRGWKRKPRARGARPLGGDSRKLELQTGRLCTVTRVSGARRVVNSLGGD
eukprot:GFKZ01012420.1.p3 GENE.GFKZ01012420.1~~GFKZ01012420.1.p3  ORF type:complete len:109 (+),score=3.91 GFKZ01012420.1:622-948(+)